MVNAAMKEKNAAFLEDHQNDTDEQLLDYLRACARKLGHTPHPREVYGSYLLTQRFSGWANAVSAAGLTNPVHQISREQCRIYTDELRIQERMFKENMEKNRAARKTANQEKAELAHAEKQARLERDARWGEANGHMTDSRHGDRRDRCDEEHFDHSAVGNDEDADGDSPGTQPHEQRLKPKSKERPQIHL